MNVELLKIGEKYLREVVDPKTFDICLWKNTPLQYEISCSTGKLCEFAGCAMGHFTQVPEFQAVGLSMIDGLPVISIKGNRYYGISAAKLLFSISMRDADWLFDARGYGILEEHDIEVTPIHVADRIAELLANHNKNQSLDVEVKS